MTIDQLKANLDAFLDYMKESGYSLFHKSNIFLRDFQFAVRDYIRATTKKDPGTRVSDAYAAEIIALMERNGQLKKLNNKTWILNMEKYLLAPVAEEEEAKEENAETSA